MRKIGIFWENQLINSYDFTWEGSLEALADARQFTFATEQIHEVKEYVEEEQ